MRQRTVLVAAVLMGVVLVGAMAWTTPAEAQTGCLVNVTCPWYVTPIYGWGMDLIYQGWGPLQIAQMAYANLGWIQGALGITEAEAFYAVTEVYWILVPQFELMNPPPRGLDDGGGSRGDDGHS